MFNLYVKCAPSCLVSRIPCGNYLTYYCKQTNENNQLKLPQSVPVLVQPWGGDHCCSENKVFEYHVCKFDSHCMLKSRYNFKNAHHIHFHSLVFE